MKSIAKAGLVCLAVLCAWVLPDHLAAWQQSRLAARSVGSAHPTRDNQLESRDRGGDGPALRLAQERPFHRELVRTYRRSIAEYEKLAAEFPSNPDYRWHLACRHELIGHLLKDAGRLDEAEAAYREALALWKKLVADSNKDDHRNHLSWT